MAANLLSNNISSPSGSTTRNRTVDAADQVSTQVRDQQMTALMSPVAIFWDIENCPVPAHVDAWDVGRNIRKALEECPETKGALKFFSAYADPINCKKIRLGCQQTGINILDVPSGKKDAADKAILVDMLFFAFDQAPPCTILLISGDVDFARALHKLGQRGYTIGLAIPTGKPVSKALYNAGRFVWDWPRVAQGDGAVPAECLSSARALDRHGCFSSEDSDVPNDEGNARTSSNQTLKSTHRAADLSRIQLAAPSPRRSGTIPRNHSSSSMRSSLFVQTTTARTSSAPINVSKSLLGSSCTDADSSGTSSDTSLAPNSTPRDQPGAIQGFEEGKLMDIVNTAGPRKLSYPGRVKGRRGGGGGRQIVRQEPRAVINANPVSDNVSSPSGSTTGNRTVDAADQVSTQVRNQPMGQEANALQKDSKTEKDSETEMEDSGT